MINLINKLPLNLRQFTKFGAVGFSGAIVDLAVYNLLAVLFGFNIYFARTISFILAVSNNYYLNRRWTFKSHEQNISIQFSKYLVVSVIGWGLNLIIMRIFEPFALRFNSMILQKNIPVIIAIIFVLFWNYFANKKWTFRK